ncbi:MAG: T9SS type A sorting domain-containing protein [Flavobacteriales bacterium]|nr:T9SS type A sorting domain-containing protein [Flavobacteriales bacterium]
MTHDYWILKLFPDTVTGIPDLESSNKILVYPNPFTTRAYISFINNNEKFHFTLCDISGRTIETVSTNNNEIIITKEGKQPGIYLYILINENTREKWMGKIIIGN